MKLFLNNLYTIYNSNNNTLLLILVLLKLLLYNEEFRLLFKRLYKKENIYKVIEQYKLENNNTKELNLISDISFVLNKDIKYKKISKIIIEASDISTNMKNINKEMMYKIKLLNFKTKGILNLSSINKKNSELYNASFNKNNTNNTNKDNTTIVFQNCSSNVNTPRSSSNISKTIKFSFNNISNVNKSKLNGELSNFIINESIELPQNELNYIFSNKITITNISSYFDVIFYLNNNKLKSFSSELLTEIKLKDNTYSKSMKGLKLININQNNLIINTNNYFDLIKHEKKIELLFNFSINKISDIFSKFIFIFEFQNAKEKTNSFRIPLLYSFSYFEKVSITHYNRIKNCDYIKEELEINLNFNLGKFLDINSNVLNIEEEAVGKYRHVLFGRLNVLNNTYNIKFIIKKLNNNADLLKIYYFYTGYDEELNSGNELFKVLKKIIIEFKN